MTRWWLLLGVLVACDTVDVQFPCVDTWYRDTDGDGFGTTDSSTLACDKPLGFVADPGDCDDGDPTIVDCGDTGT